MMRMIDIRRLSSKMLAGVLAVGALSVLAADCSLYDLRVNGMASPENVGTAPVFSWKTQGGAVARRQAAVRITVRKAGESANVWDSGEVSSDLTTGFRYAGSALASATKYAWQAKTKDAAGAWTAAADGTFTTGILADSDWSGASWIEPSSGSTKGVCQFVATKSVSKAVKEAYWCVTALGLFEAYVNGEPVTAVEPDGSRVRDFLKPGYTKTSVRHAWTYDVTSQLKSGANVLAARVGRGWWSDGIISKNNENTAAALAFRGQLIVRYADGSTETFGTNTTDWKGRYSDPVTFASIYGGEDYDARLSLDWLSGGATDESWLAVKTRSWNGSVRPFPSSNVRCRDDLALKPVDAYVYSTVSGTASGAHGDVVKARAYADGEAMTVNDGETLVLDFGQNCAGNPSFVFAAANGVTAQILNAETLNDAGGKTSRGCDGPGSSLYRANYRTARSSASYVFAGAGSESWMPSFTFFGSRYFSVKAVGGTITLASARLMPFTSLPKGFETGTLATGSEKVNRLVKNCLWGQYSNYLSIPTDCPQRDERAGWTGDTQLFAPAACWNANSAPFLGKWLADIRDAIAGDGKLNAVVPTTCSTVGIGNNEAGWTDAAVIVPWLLYRRYGDINVLKDAWDACVKYMKQVRDNGYTGYGYGDWLAYDVQKPADTDYVRAAYFIHCCHVMTEIATALGKTSEAAEYAALAAERRTAFRANLSFFANGAVVLPDTRLNQTRLLMALRFGLLDAVEIPGAAAQLETQFKNAGYTLKTGFLGTPLVLDGLTQEAGNGELAYTMLLQENCKGWLYTVNQGATTMWERWNSYTTASGFGAASMNSFNHYSYGAVEDWMFTTMAGIRDDIAHPGFKRFTLQPVVDARLGSCAATYESPYGTIASSWTCAANGDYSWTFTVPVNTTASVVRPGRTMATTYNPGTYTVTGNVSDPGDDPTVKTATLPAAVTGLKYNGETQTGVAGGEGYTISGNTGKDARSYTATLTLAGGYGKWSDGSAEKTRTISWSIAKGVNAWTTEPSVSPATWAEDSVPVTIAFSTGVNAFGAAVTCDTDEATLKAMPAGQSKTVTFSAAGCDNYDAIAFEVTVKVTASQGEDPETEGSAELTCSNYKGTETLADFPMLVRISPTAIPKFSYDGLAANLIAFKDASGNELAYDVDTWNPDGESLVWVKVPTLATTTKITFEWGKASGVTACDTWSGYAGVWHFNEGTRGTYASSGATANSAKAVNGASAIASGAAKVGGGVTFTRGTVKANTLQANNVSLAAGGPVTFSGWWQLRDVRKVSTDTYPKLFTIGGYSDGGYYLQCGDNGTGTKLTSDIVTAKNTVSETVLGDSIECLGGSLHHVVVTIRPGQTQVWIDGEKKVDSPAVNCAFSGKQFALIGEVGSATVDEIRLRNSAVSADWIAADYRQQASADGVLYTVGGEPPAPVPEVRPAEGETEVTVKAADANAAKAAALAAIVAPEGIGRDVYAACFRAASAEPQGDGRWKVTLALDPEVVKPVIEGEEGQKAFAVVGDAVNAHITNFRQGLWYALEYADALGANADWTVDAATWTQDVDLTATKGDGAARFYRVIVSDVKGRTNR